MREGKLAQVTSPWGKENVLVVAEGYDMNLSDMSIFKSENDVAVLMRLDQKYRLKETEPIPDPEKLLLLLNSRYHNLLSNSLLLTTYKKNCLNYSLDEISDEGSVNISVTKDGAIVKDNLVGKC